MRSLRLTVLGFGLFFLAACGGGGGGSPSALTSSSAPNSGNSNASGSELSTSNGGASTTSGEESGDCQAEQLISAARNDGLRISSVRYLQVVEQDSSGSSALLVSDKPLTLRVDLLANAGTLAPLRRSALVFNPMTGQCQSFRLTGPAVLPEDVDNTRLDEAFSVTLPAAAVKPGMSITIVFDDNRGRSRSEAASVKRQLTPRVMNGVRETIRIIPLKYDGQIGFANANSIKSVIERTTGVSSVVVSTENAISPKAFAPGLLDILGKPGQFGPQAIERVLAEVDAECGRLNGGHFDDRSSPKCLGVFPNNVHFMVGTGEVVGVAYIGGKSMVAQSVGASDITSTISPYASAHWLDFRAVTVAHEYGHILNLEHAACGVDASKSSAHYDDGRIGASGAGYDIGARNGQGFYFSAERLDASGKPQFSDLMSYCQKAWPSDRGFKASTAYRAGGASSREAGAQGAPTKRWLRVTGFDGEWLTEAVYTAPARLAPTAMKMRLRASDGQHELVLQRAQIADLPLASAAGPYYVELPQSAIGALPSIAWQLLNSTGQLIRSGVGELLSQP